jgi:sodium transport system permease protein
MTWRNIRLILHREIRDQLRDRRTLFMVVVLPLLLYPGLGLLAAQMSMLLAEQPRHIVVLGAAELPELPLIEEGRFSKRWFSRPDDAGKVLVISDSEKIASSKDVELQDRVQQLKAAQEVRVLVEERNALARSIAPYNRRLLDELPGVEAARLRAKMDADKPLAPPAEFNLAAKMAELKELKKQIGEKFTTEKLQAVLIIPDGFGETLAQIDSLLGQENVDSAALHELPLLRPIVVRNRASQKSDLAYRRIVEALNKWEKQLLNDRLQIAGLPETVVDPVSVMAVDVASEGEIANMLWSRIFPALLVIMALTGAFYPAIDIASGEKERGTMETLLICPATRSEIVIGKFLTVLAFSVSTTILNLISMGFTGRTMVSMAAAATTGPMSNIPLPTPLALFWLVVLLLPLAALFSALSLALATFARSTKEGQYYLTPLFMFTMGLTMFSMMPTVELEPEALHSTFYCAIPIVGPALLLKALLSNPAGTEVLVFALPVLMSSVTYCLLALWWAVEQFKSEDVLFRADERFDLRLWLRHLLREKDPTPSFSQGICCFVVMMMMQFLSMWILTGTMSDTPESERGWRVLQLGLVSQIALIAAPALFMAILLTSNFRKTLKLRLPSWSIFGMAIALPLLIFPLAMELLTGLAPYFPQLPESFRAAFATMGDGELPLWAIIGTFALAPAICEELAFRGFILSGFSSGGRWKVAIVLSSVTFGVIHMVPQQVFNASLLGLVLGLLAVRSRSLLPGIVFHFCFNTLGVMHSRVSEALASSTPGWLESSVARWFFTVQTTEAGTVLRFDFPLLAVCGVVTFLLIRSLIRMKPATEAERVEAPSSLAMNSPAT